MNDGKLRELVAQFWNISLNEVDDQLVFDATRLRGISSIRFYRFIAAVESNFGVRIVDPAAITTYLALRNAVGSSTPTPSESRRPSHAPGNNHHDSLDLISLGHDIEEIENLPVAEDYSTDLFYTRQFTPAEIAWCTQRTNPRQHFAVRFCAKEALRKCGALFRDLQPIEIEVVGDDAGKPGILIHRENVNRALGRSMILVSLTHTERIASAVVFILKAGL
jgi:holo-[acyl-carrier protein] synthase